MAFLSHRRSSWLPSLLLIATGCGGPSGEPGLQPTPSSPPRSDEPNADPGASPSSPEGTPLAPQVPGDIGTAVPETGGQTGDDSGSIGLECDRVTTRTLALDEASPLGFAPNDLFPFVLGSHTLSLSWLSPVYGPDGTLLDYSPRATDEVQVEVELGGDEARVLERWDSRYDMRCPDLVEQDVHLTLKSADGALAERVDGALDLRTGFAGFSTSLPAAALIGNFAFDPSELEGRSPAGLHIALAFTRYGLTGQLTEQYGTDGNIRGLSVARWPSWAATCDFRGFTPVLDETLHPSASDILDTVRGNAPLTLISARGDRAPVQLEISAVPQSACFEPDIDGGPLELIDELNVETELTLTSAALPGPVRLPIQVVGSFSSSDPESLASHFKVALSPCGTNYYSAQDFVSHCGDWGIDLTGYDGAFLDIESHFSPFDGYAAFKINAIQSPGCTPGPMGYTCTGDATGADIHVVTLGEVRLLGPE